MKESNKIRDLLIKRETTSKVRKLQKLQKGVMPTKEQKEYMLSLVTKQWDEKVLLEANIK